MSNDATTIDEPDEPDRLAGERDTLLGFIDFYRAVLLRKGDGLDVAALETTTASSTLTIGRLLRHATLVEDHWFQQVLAGGPEPEPWASAPWDDDPDWEMTTAAGMSFDALRVDFEAACERSRATLANHTDLSYIAPGSLPDQPTTLRWILVHMIEEYARHAGHADFLREAIDGRAGD